MAYENLLVEKKDGIAVVTVNRPDKLNALNPAFFVELRGPLEEFRAARRRLKPSFARRSRLL